MRFCQLAREANYIIGNPPFLSYSRLNAQQKADRARIFGKSGGLLDYVARWYKLAADDMRENTRIEAALVSTNSGSARASRWLLCGSPCLSLGIVDEFCASHVHLG